jgi:hypothetical protein
VGAGLAAAGKNVFAVSLNDHTLAGSQEEIFRHYGIDGPRLATTARRLLANHSR